MKKNYIKFLTEDDVIIESSEDEKDEPEEEDEDSEEDEEENKEEEDQSEEEDADLSVEDEPQPEPQEDDQETDESDSEEVSETDFIDEIVFIDDKTYQKVPDAEVEAASTEEGIMFINGVPYRELDSSSEVNDLDVEDDTEKDTEVGLYTVTPDEETDDVNVIKTKIVESQDGEKKKRGRKPKLG